METGNVATARTKNIVIRIPSLMAKRDYTLEEIDAIVASYQAGNPGQKSESLSLLIDIFEFYFLKYVKLTKGNSESTYDNKEAQEFLRLFVSKKEGGRKSFVEVKRNIAATLSSYDHQDMYNEFVALFITLLNKYEKREGVNFMRYITRYFRWMVRNWICRISKDPLFHLSEPDENEEKEIDPPMDAKNKYFEEQSKKIGVMLNSHKVHPDPVSLKWVLQCDKWIFSKLTPYQRYLLYLYFVKGEGCVNIARRMHKSKDTISSHMEKIYHKLAILER